MMEDGARSSGKAITSLVLGLVSFVCVCLTGIPAIIFGFVALSDIKKSQSRLTGEGMAITGIVLGFVGSAATLLVLILPALLLPAIQAARNAARGAGSVFNMVQIGAAMHTKADETNTFPAQYTLDAQGNPGSSWRVQLLPYLDRKDAFQLYHFDEPWNSPGNTQALAVIPTQFVNPLDDSSRSMTKRRVGYLGVAGPGFVFDGDKPCKREDVKDGLENTIMVVDVTDSDVEFAEPRDLTWDEFLARYQADDVGGDHRGFHALMADGNAYLIPYGLDERTLQAYFTIAGDEKVPPPASYRSRP